MQPRSDSMLEKPNGSTILDLKNLTDKIVFYFPNHQINEYNYRTMSSLLNDTNAVFVLDKSKNMLSVGAFSPSSLETWRLAIMSLKLGQILYELELSLLTNEEFVVWRNKTRYL